MTSQIYFTKTAHLSNYLLIRLLVIAPLPHINIHAPSTSCRKNNNLSSASYICINQSCYRRTAVSLHCCTSVIHAFTPCQLHLHPSIILSLPHHHTTTPLHRCTAVCQLFTRSLRDLSLPHRRTAASLPRCTVAPMYVEWSVIHTLEERLICCRKSGCP